MKEKRREERFLLIKRPKFISAEITLKTEHGDNVTYNFPVYDSSKRGIGLFINEKNKDFLNIIEVEDKIEKIVFYAENALLKTTGVIRHKTEIKEGKYKGCFIVGIETFDL